jgi:hypothetical protein
MDAQTFVKKIFSAGCPLLDALVGGNNHVPVPIEFSTEAHHHHHARCADRRRGEDDDHDHQLSAQPTYAGAAAPG